jgi:hypothetical protein
LLFAVSCITSAIDTGCIGGTFPEGQTLSFRADEARSLSMDASGTDTIATKENSPNLALNIGLRRSKPIKKEMQGSLPASNRQVGGRYWYGSVN